MLKRGFDFILGGLLFAASLPILLCAAILIRFDSAGPVLFRQTRVGRNFRPFRIYKLRTMRVGHRGAAYTSGADPRITRVGYWLRRFKVDELPQLWNVLRGEMSLIGPRPVVPDLAGEFRQEYEQLLRFCPGLTDPATIKYCHESEMLAGEWDPMRTFKHVVTPDKLRLSLDYQHRATLWSDLKLMLWTALAVLVPGLVRAASAAVAPRVKVLVFPSPAAAARSVLLLEPSALPIPAGPIPPMRATAGLSNATVLGKKTGSGVWG